MLLLSCWQRRRSVQGKFEISLMHSSTNQVLSQNCRAWLSLAAYVPGAISSVLLLSMSSPAHSTFNAIRRLKEMQGLPWSNRWGLLTGIWIRSTVGIPYAVVMIWAANASAGHTKKTTVIAMYHIGYGLGNILSPQLFQPRWKVSIVQDSPGLCTESGCSLGVSLSLATTQRGPSS